MGAGEAGECPQSYSDIDSEVAMMHFHRFVRDEFAWFSCDLIPRPLPRRREGENDKVAVLLWIRIYPQEVCRYGAKKRGGYAPVNSQENYRWSGGHAEITSQEERPACISPSVVEGPA